MVILSDVETNKLNSVATCLWSSCPFLGKFGWGEVFGKRRGGVTGRRQQGESDYVCSQHIESQAIAAS